MGYSPWGHKDSDTTEQLPPPPQKNTQFEMCLCLRLYFYRCWAIDSQSPKVHEREAKGDLTVGTVMQEKM